MSLFLTYQFFNKNEAKYMDAFTAFYDMHSYC